jgi:uncharacterized membrane protein required for colicin V production
MIEGYMWPDIVIVIVALLGAAKGYTRGFVSEIAGAVAIVLGFCVPWWYRGAADRSIESVLHLTPGIAHIIGMILSGVAIYAIVLAIAWFVNRFARLPVINIANALGGAAVGMFKSAVLLWFVLFVALFFPLTPGLRADMHRSKLVEYLTAPNALIDYTVVVMTPKPVRSVIAPYFARHRV